MSKASGELIKKMAEEVDVDNLWRVHHPNLHEKLVLELSTELEKQKDRDYFNRHGFVDTLTYMLSLRDKFEKEQDQ